MCPLVVVGEDTLRIRVRALTALLLVATGIGQLLLQFQSDYSRIIWVFQKQFLTRLQLVILGEYD